MPYDYTAFVIGAKETAEKIRLAADDIDRAVYERMITAGLWLETTAKDLVPKRTNNLMRAIRYDVRRFSKHWELYLVVDDTAPYGPFIEYGTGIYGKYHRPYPVRRGSTVFMHPGMKAQPFIEPSFDVNEPMIRDLFNEIGHQIAREA